eukprot:GHRR01034119.1.p4 GENE.GHRR01034119.1~~GHRR01034119.1.p4  ORF type:complete len:120 (-),score=17.06 GHRR01034119.1:537-896(-)
MQATDTLHLMHGEQDMLARHKQDKNTHPTLAHQTSADKAGSHMLQAGQQATMRTMQYCTGPLYTFKRVLTHACAPVLVQTPSSTPVLDMVSLVGDHTALQCSPAGEQRMLTLCRRHMTL